LYVFRLYLEPADYTFSKLGITNKILQSSLDNCFRFRMYLMKKNLFKGKKNSLEQFRLPFHIHCFGLPCWALDWVCIFYAFGLIIRPCVGDFCTIRESCRQHPFSVYRWMNFYGFTALASHWCGHWIHNRPWYLYTRKFPEFKISLGFWIELV